VLRKYAWLIAKSGGVMDESPIERSQREFAEKSKIVRPAKTAGSEYFGILAIITLIVVIVVLFYLGMS